MAEERKQEKVFYSWQNDVSTKDNRYFIENALKKAIEAVNREGVLIHELILDRDTKDVPGAPVIAETILGKIDQAGIFVADVTIIARAESGKPVPNPNVMIELGYALKALSHDSLVLVLNTAYGDIQDLPFDLRHRRIMTYNLLSVSDNQEAGKSISKESARELQKDFEKALREFLKRPAKVVEPVISTIERFEEYLLDPTHTRKARNLIDKEVEKLLDALNEISSSEIAKDESPEGVYTLMQAYERAAANVLALFIRGGHEADSELTETLVKGLKHVAHVQSLPHRYGSPHLYPALLLLYAGGIAALAGKKYPTLIALMRHIQIRTPDDPQGHPAAYHLVPYRVIKEKIAKQLPPIGPHHTPISKYLFQILREPLRQVIKIDGEYGDCFFRFEYLFALASAYTIKDTGGANAPVGSYLWEQNLRQPPYIFQLTDEELRRQKDAWPPFKAGIYDGSFDDFLRFKEEVDGSIKKMIGLFYGGLNV